MTIDGLGRITWSPTSRRRRHRTTSSVTVTDGRGGTATQTFDLAVAADTQAPRVSLTVSPNPVDDRHEP